MMIVKAWSLVNKSMKFWNLKLIQDWLCAELAFSGICGLFFLPSDTHTQGRSSALKTSLANGRILIIFRFYLLKKITVIPSIIYFVTVYKEILFSITHSSSSKETCLKPYQKIVPALYSLIKQRPTFKGKARKAASMAQKDVVFSSRNTCGR